MLLKKVWARGHWPVRENRRPSSWAVQPVRNTSARDARWTYSLGTVVVSRGSAGSPIPISLVDRLIENPRLKNSQCPLEALFDAYKIRTYRFS
ncbi:hypothetical protein OHB54_45795 [Streptomyces sp. NBC_01007]|nr:hypothetical protein OHB54_45795 [Streptomyces sp. NBC_01007]